MINFSCTCIINFMMSCEFVEARPPAGIIGIAQSRIAPETRSEITKIIAWDLDMIRSGCFSERDWNGKPWPANSWRARQIGKRLPYAVFSYWKGDQEAHVKSHFLTRYYNKAYVCDWCLASGSDPNFNYGDFSSTAVWRSTEEHHLEAPLTPERSPWLQVQGYNRRRRMFDRNLAFFISHRYYFSGISMDEKTGKMMRHSVSLANAKLCIYAISASCATRRHLFWCRR